MSWRPDEIQRNGIGFALVIRKQKIPGDDNRRKSGDREVSVVKLLWFTLFVLPLCMNAQVLTVCDALSRLSELNGKEVQIRAAWQMGDTGEWLWATDPCPHPIVHDGWIWKPIISVEREDPDNIPRWGSTMLEFSGLKSSRPEALVIVATLSGRLITREHFKISRFSRLPEAYGYSCAQLLVDHADHLEVMLLSSRQLSSIEQVELLPWPVRSKKKARNTKKGPGVP